MGRSKKGGQFEREVAKHLGLWWTNGERDDVFWRTSNSGGRATARGKVGRRTHGNYGDLKADDPIGAPLLRLLTIELKRGYKDAHVGDVLDRGAHLNPRPWEQFVTQAKGEAFAARTPFWLLVVRRDARQAMVFMPHELYLNFRFEGSTLNRARPWILVRPPFRECSDSEVVGTSLEKFCKHVTPKQVRAVAKVFC